MTAAMSRGSLGILLAASPEAQNFAILSRFWSIWSIFLGARPEDAWAPSFLTSRRACIARGWGGIL